MLNAMATQRAAGHRVNAAPVGDDGVDATRSAFVSNMPMSLRCSIVTPRIAAS